MRKSLREQIPWVVEHWRPYRAMLAWIVALTLVNGLVTVMYPVFLERIVDGIEGSLSTRHLLINVALLLTFGALHAAVYYLLQFARLKVNLSMDYGIRIRAFEHMLRMGPSFFHRFRTGDLVTRLTDDVTEKLAWYLCSGLLRTLEALVVIGFGVLMMLRMDPGLTLAAAGPLPILIGIYILVASRLEGRYRAVQSAISRINDALESAFSGIRVVKGFGVEPTQKALVEGAIEGQRRAEIRAVRYQTLIDALYGHIWQLAIILVLLVGGAAAMRGDITLGRLVAFDAYVLLLVWPMFDLGQFLVRGRVSAVSISRISELEEVEPEVGDPRRASLLPRRPGEPIVAPRQAASTTTEPLTLTAEGVAYRYAGADHPAITGISFEAVPGSITAVVGEVGSGKTSLLNLVPRLVDPGSGHLSMGDESVSGWPLGALRERVGMVSQDPVLFSDTVRENVRFGRSWIPREDLDMAVRVSALKRDLAEWSEGLETVVGNRGIQLSGGQKQRVALARALAGRPSVLLLDDCTSALDASTEDAVWKALFEELPTCTTLVVTHRPATLERADRILLLEGGRVIADGTFAELHRDSAPFRELYTRFSLESALEETGREGDGGAEGR